jgi:hypothetical protein
LVVSLAHTDWAKAGVDNMAPAHSARDNKEAGDFGLSTMSGDMFSEVASSSPLLQNLNPEQYAAVTLPSTHALILAGAVQETKRVYSHRVKTATEQVERRPGHPWRSFPPTRPQRK